MNDINDVFSAIACCEDKVNRKSYEEGFSSGSEAGWKNGHHLGYHKGAETGAQIGYYAGFIHQLMKSDVKLKELKQYDKVIATIQKLDQLTNDFPKTNDSSYDIQAILEESKTLFRKLCALLKFQCNLPESKFITY